MPRSPTPATRVRPGTATNQTGKATAIKVVDAARELLMESGHKPFTMRNVAAQAGLHLANVQYYFPKRRDLIRALFADTGERYLRAYDELLSGASDDPVERFELVLRYNMKDILDDKTRRFFIPFWALLGEMDEHSGRLLGELYAIDIAHLQSLIADMHPDTDGDEIERRARLLAALIEGLMVVRGAKGRRSRGMQELIDDTVSLGMHIANGVASDRPG